MTYTELLQKLYCVNLHGGIKLGLANPKKLDEKLGFPSKGFKSVHIAGSNGKGSTATKIAAGLEAEGFRVGLYTSPHISCFRERIRINSEMIPEQAVEQLLSQIFALKFPATFFEITTALAFLYFAQSDVDYAVIETGLGGRFDATNIIFPQLAVITSLSLEHTQILGKTIGEIAKEKAGIIKEDIPVVLGPKAACISELTTNSVTTIQGNFSTFRQENNAVAKEAMQQLGLSPSSIEQGLQKEAPCRMETFGNVILDVAHNPDGLRRLFQEVSSPVRVLCGISKQKEIKECLEIIQSHAQEVFLLDIEHPRLCDPEELQLLAPRAQIKDPQDALSYARNSEAVLVTGSFYIMPPIRLLLGVYEESDPFELQESWEKRPPLACTKNAKSNKMKGIGSIL